MYFNEVDSTESSLNALMSSVDPCLKVVAVKMELKFQKYWQPIEKMHVMLLIAIVLGTSFKLRHVTWCYRYYFKLNDSKVVEPTEKIRDTFNSIYVE